MTMAGEVTECPICGGNLQATVTRYTRDVRLTPTGFLDSIGEIQEHLTCDDEDANIYCENDHTLAAMRDSLRKR